MVHEASRDLSSFLGDQRFGTVMADPPWRFTNRTGKIAPEHKRLARYQTMGLQDICDLPVENHLEETAHCYLWVPNALLPEGLQVLAAWGFEYKSNIIWHKIRMNRPEFAEGVCVQMLRSFLIFVQAFIECFLCFLGRDVADGTVQSF